MSTFYDLAGDDVKKIVDLIIERDRKELKTAGLRVDILFIAADDDDGLVLKLHGHLCAAVVRITSAKERAAGRGDAEIVIDRAAWNQDGMTPRRREALLFHELWHLQLKTVDGIPQVDANERPKLKMREHDHEFGWFNEVARRYGEDSYEVRQANGFRQEAAQMHFGWELGGKTSAKKVTA